MKTVLFMLLCLPLLAMGQNPQLFVSGAVELTYAQFPFGSFSGQFSVEGEIDTTDFTPTFNAGVGGAMYPDSTSGEQLICLAAEAVPEDTTWNVFGLWLRSPEALQPGEIDNPASIANLFLLWHVDSLALPTQPDSIDLQDFLGALVAQYKLVGVATSLSIDQMQDPNLSLSFGGTLVDLDNNLMIVNVTNGHADLVGLPMVDVDESPLAPRSPSLVASPNPFNPATTLSILSPRPGRVALRAHDLLGRLVDRQELGFHRAGRWQAAWSPPADLASGSYLLSLDLDGVPLAGTRVMLVK